MKVIITGSSGFIGSHLKTRLEKEHEIIEYDTSIGKDIKSFKVSDAEFVIHLAATADVRRSIKYPEEYWENNVVTTTEIQRQCDRMNVPLLYASSSCAARWWLSPYGTTKKVNEETAFGGQVGLRFTTVYGEGARESMLIGKIVRQEVGYLTPHVRDFIYVDDVVDAIILLMEKYREIPLKSYYNIGTGKGVRVDSLGEFFGLDVPVLSGDDCEAEDNTADNQDLLDLGWKPKMGIENYIASKLIPH